mmetsp:Transcript_24204/g.22008  ORF Transcript_24204/g.22008 Transcript_24204/m.22008 type:complete len:230 (+) Transcript_24204:154-843(+)
MTREISVYTLSVIASNVYSLADGYNEDKLNKSLQSEGYSVIKESVRGESFGILRMAVWRHSSNGNIVLAIKGTTLTEGTDLINDITLALGGTSAILAVQPTLATARDLINKYNVNLITGHSLGGYITEIIATNDNIPGIAFCAPGSNGPIVRLGGTERTGFHNINFEHDVLGNILPGIYTHVQWSIYISGGYHHSIDLMVDYFRPKPGITNLNVQSRSTSRLTGYYDPN